MAASHLRYKDSEHGVMLDKAAQSKGIDSGSSIQEFKCAECLKTIRRKRSMAIHITSHSGLKPYACKECDLRFRKKEALDGHLMYHQQKQKYKCNTCTASYGSMNGLRNHISMHKNPNYGYVICMHCKFYFLDDAVLKCHIRARHTSKLQFECEVCSAQFENLEYINKHMEIHGQQLQDTDNVETLKCSKCEVECNSFSEMMLHSRTHAVKHECLECGLQFMLSGDLVEHTCQNVNRSLRPKPTKSDISDTVWKCMECLTGFSKRHYKLHILSHSGLKRYKCKECGLRFSAKQFLQEHTRFHQEKRQYSCDICTASYSDSGSLKKHKNMHKHPDGHGYIICDQCRFLFASSFVLRQHVAARHDTKQRYECNMCGAQFEEDRHLSQHMKIHDQLSKAEAMHMKNCAQISPKLPETEKLVTKKAKTDCRNLRLNKTSTQPKQRGLVSSHMPSKKRKTGLSSSTPVCRSLDKTSVTELVVALLNKLVDKEVLESEGMLNKPVHTQLQAVVEICGHTPVMDNSRCPEENIVDNLKLLFALSVGEASTGMLLEFKSLEEILCSI